MDFGCNVEYKERAFLVKENLKSLKSQILSNKLKGVGEREHFWSKKI
jgi:hypothetical protein